MWVVQGSTFLNTADSRKK